MANILLADDDVTVRDLVKRALSSEGHAVHVTQDGTEALEYFEANSSAIDIIVTDIEMPGLDGISLARRASALNNGIGVVLMSGYSEQLDRASGLKIDRMVSISKPFTLEQIRKAVRGVSA